MNTQELAYVDSQPAEQPRSEIARLIEVAITKDLDLDKLEKLLELKRQEEDRVREQAFLRAKASFQSKMPDIRHDKTAKTPGATWKYASLGSITKAISPILGKHGLSYRWEVDDEANKLLCILTHKDGHSESASFTLSIEGQQGGLAKMTQQQREGAADTYAKSRTLKHVCGIGTADEDTDGLGARGEQPLEEKLVNNLKHAWRKWQIESGKADENTPSDILAGRFADFAGNLKTQSDLKDAWTRLSELRKPEEKENEDASAESQDERVYSDRG